jgi:hypothetical protein
MLRKRKPQIFASGFSRRLKGALRSSCSTLSLRSSPRNQIEVDAQIWLQSHQIAHPQWARINGRRAFHFECGNYGIAPQPKNVNQFDSPCCCFIKLRRNEERFITRLWIFVLVARRNAPDAPVTCSNFWQIFGKLVFDDDSPNEGKA